MYSNSKGKKAGKGPQNKKNKPTKVGRKGVKNYG